MTCRLCGLLIVSFLSSCSITSDHSTDISSVDSVKKYLDGTWLQRDQHTTTEYKFIKDFRGFRVNGIKHNEETLINASNPDGFELIEENDTIRIKFRSIDGRTSATIKYLSKDRLIVNQTEYHKLNSR